MSNRRLLPGSPSSSVPCLRPWPLHEWPRYIPPGKILPIPHNPVLIFESSLPQTASSPVSRITCLRDSLFFMQATVRCLLSVQRQCPFVKRIDVPRCWCSLFPTCSDAVLANESLVLPLPRVARHRYHQHYPTSLRVPVQDPRTCVVHIQRVIYSMLMHYPTECFAAIGLASPAEDHGSDRSGSKYRQMMRLRDVHLMACFILIYVGVEVTLGGKSSRYPHCEYLQADAEMLCRVDCHIRH